MNRFTRSLLLFSATLFHYQLAAEQKVDPSVFGEVDIKQSAFYQTPGIVIAELESGDIYLATADGRFVIKNPTIIQSVNAKVLNSFDDFKLAMTPTLHDMGIEPREYFVGYTINKSAADFGGTLFVAPNCSACKTFKQELQSRYPSKQFFIAIAPILSADDYKNTILASCSANPEGAYQALLSGSFSEHRFPKVGDCKQQVSDVNVTVAGLRLLSTGQMGVPTFAGGANTQVGLPKDFAKFERVFFEGAKQ
ncbi:hypothetical protein ACP3V5_17410 [Vibrio maritimus]